MAEMTIRLQTDPETGKKDIIVSLRSDADALPMEHEQQHRALVEKLIEGGLVQVGEIGQIVVEREEETPQGEAPQSSETSEREAQAEGQS